MINYSEIPQGTSSAEILQRKQIIKNFYAQWNAINPTKHIYNIDLKDFINIKFLSIQETSEIASRRYKSTIAVFHLTEILENAKILSINKSKSHNANQKRFSEVIIMRYNKADFGEIKLTIGVLRGSKQKIQYCITAIENDF
jgi:ADP-glucose pyrophosphorylase